MESAYAVKNLLRGNRPGESLVVRATAKNTPLNENNRSDGIRSEEVYEATILLVFIRLEKKEKINNQSSELRSVKDLFICTCT